jgi:hypothetical protein
MRVLLTLLLAVISVNVEAKLCIAQVCETGDDSKCRKAFLFVDNKPTKTISGTVSKLLECKDLPTLVYDADAGKDQCMEVVLTYINAVTGKKETYLYRNGATSTDGINWDREQNPGCPAL